MMSFLNTIKEFFFEKTEEVKKMPKYLSISVPSGIALQKVLEAVKESKDHVNFAAFKNEKKEKPTQPDYRGKESAVWVKEYTKEEKVEGSEA